MIEITKANIHSLNNQTLINLVSVDGKITDGRDKEFNVLYPAIYNRQRLLLKLELFTIDRFQMTRVFDKHRHDKRVINLPVKKNVGDSFKLQYFLNNMEVIIRQRSRLGLTSIAINLCHAGITIPRTLSKLIDVLNELPIKVTLCIDDAVVLPKKFL